MAASALTQSFNLIFWARKQAASTTPPSTAQAVLDALTIGAGAGFAAGGGRLISASVNGKSFAYQLDPSLGVSDLLEALREADALLGTYADDQLTALLSAPRDTADYIHFGGCCY